MPVSTQDGRQLNFLAKRLRTRSDQVLQVCCETMKFTRSRQADQYLEHLPVPAVRC